MKKIDLHQVDAFTDRLFGGNSAGVVTNADQLTVQEMKQIAREMNLSETAFVLSPSGHEADVRLRFFTCTGDEVQFCGHATVGTLFQLAQLKSFGLGESGQHKVRVETGIGMIAMTVTNTVDVPEVTFTAPPVTLEPYRLQGEDAAKALSVAPDLFLAESGTMLLDTTLNYLYIPVASLKALGDQQFNATHVRQTFRAEGIVVFCFYSNETVHPHSDLHARGLAPLIGIDEDPFTGSMQAGLVQAAKQNNFIKEAQEHIITEQGNFVGRPGFAMITHADDQLMVTAKAVQVFSTTLEIAE